MPNLRAFYETVSRIILQKILNQKLYPLSGWKVQHETLFPQKDSGRYADVVHRSKKDNKKRLNGSLNNDLFDTRHNITFYYEARSINFFPAYCTTVARSM